MYIDDCIEALLLMEKHASYPPLVLNIGNPRTATIRKLAEVVVRTSGKQIRPRYDPSKPMGPISRIPAIGEARRKIGWTPATSLEAGVEKTYRWMERLLAQSEMRNGA